MSLLHFLQFFFFPAGKPWWEGAVWGNVIAVLPLGALAVIGWFWHKSVVDNTKRIILKHDVHLKKLLDALDPDTEGGVAELHQKLEQIKDAIDPTTAGGIGELVHNLTKGNNASNH